MWKVGDTVRNKTSGAMGTILKVNVHSLYVKWNTIGERQIPFDHPAYRNIASLRVCASCDEEPPEDDYLCKACRTHLTHSVWNV